ncbi:MAG: M20/M25/M40 family metallo-hydrolase [Pseudomonadota bacterium]
MIADAATLIHRSRSRKAALVEATQALVRLDTQTPPSDTRAAAELAREMLGAIPGLSVTLHQSEPPVVNLVARLPGGQDGPRLVLSGHLDTYPIGEGAWTHGPLSGAVADGKLWGRGSADMKGACVTLIECLRLFADMRPFPGEIVLALAGDEERMGELGTQWLIDHVPEVRGDAVIVGDVGGPHTVRLGEKGMVWLDLEAEGRQAHGAHVHAGENAADRLIDALSDLRALERLAIETPAEAAEVVAAAAEMPGADGPAARATMTRVTVNLGCLSGGLSANLVPSQATAGLDIRIPLGVSVATVEAAAAEILARHPRISWTPTRRYEPTWTSRRSRIAAAGIDAGRRVLGVPVFPDMRIGGSDARLWRRAGMETIVQGLTPYNLGAPDEHLDIRELSSLLAIQCIAAATFLAG